MGYQNESGSVDCKACQPCAKGKKRVGCGKISRGECPSCVQGKYKDVIGEHHTKCDACEAGKFGDKLKKKDAESHCQKCADGQYQPSSAATSCLACTPCGDGKFLGGSCKGDNAGQCQACAAGRSKSGVDTWDATCTDCSDGEFQDHQGQATCKACQPCGPGLKRVRCAGATAGQCVSRINGRFKSALSKFGAWDSSCEVCPTGKFSNAKSVGQPATGPQACDTCATGRYQDQIEQTTCKACESCAAGYFRPKASALYGCGSSTAGGCQKCAVGKFKESGKNSGKPWDTACKKCPTGKWQDLQAQSSCKSCQPCAAGYKRVGCSGSSQGTCVACGKGTYKDARGDWNSDCIACSPGTFAASQATVKCADCATGQYQEFEGQSTCEVCCPMKAGCGYSGDGAGETLEGCGGSSRGQCTDCADGSYKIAAAAPLACKKPAWNAQCTLCPKGRMGHASFAKTHASHCRDCANGRFQLLTGKSSCDKCATCPSGKFRLGCGTDSAGECDTCAQGSWKDGHHSWDTGCKLCHAGKFGDATSTQHGPYHCKNCARGHLRVEKGATFCYPCPAGKYQANEGETTCMECPAGKFTPKSSPQSGHAVCTACPAGKHQSYANKHECDKCAVGKFTAKSGRDSCTGCAKGKFQPAKGISACDDCAKGYVQPAQGKDACNACPGGKYAATEGLLVCTMCAKGRYQPNSAHDSCIKCQLGQFQPQAGVHLSCNKCAEGRFQDGRGMTSCIKCAAGRFGETGKTGATTSAYCEACQHGTYQFAQGQTSCIACLAGKAGLHGDHGATSEQEHCTTCAAGTYAAVAGATHSHYVDDCTKDTGSSTHKCSGHSTAKPRGSKLAQCVPCRRLDGLRFWWSKAD